MKFYTYIIRCADDTLYTGWTTDVAQRLKTHNSGKGAKYTRARTPVRLMAAWDFQSKQEAMSFEWHLKKLSRSKKMELIAAAAN